MKIRVVTTASKAKAVQVVSYHSGKRVVLKHLGSSHNKQDLATLMLCAQQWIKDYSGRQFIFPDQDPNLVLHLNHSTFLGIKYHFFYEQITAIQHLLDLKELPALFKDLVVIRIFEPASKLRSLELIELYFGVSHTRKMYYKIARECIALKQLVEQKVVTFASLQYGFVFDILFYDVTTLYFESFDQDELRKNGFSKDNKFQQPQILVALIVSKEGFPVGYEMFSGNTFEGHTIIPVISAFIGKHSVKECTVVADAAMISAENIKALTDTQINYIVGARLGNISIELLEAIDKGLPRKDGATIRIKTPLGFLICSYSSLRYRKDKYEMEKQLEKAKQAVANPSTNKRLKFTQTKQQKIELNASLIEKTTKLLGIKGYYTNVDESIVDNATVMARYHELYKIEQAFRISKSDLQTRPIFHYKEEPIKLHLLICFLALVISKHIELKTGLSIKRFIQEAKKVVDGEIFNHITHKKATIKATPNDTINAILAKIHPPH